MSSMSSGDGSNVAIENEKTLSQPLMKILEMVPWRMPLA